MDGLTSSPYGASSVAAVVEAKAPQRNPTASSALSKRKRVVDILGALLITALLSPVLLLIAMLVRVRMPGGPVLYKHGRVGLNGREFQCYKFRSMVADGDRVLKELLDRDPEARQQWVSERKLRNDPRVTPLGALLRKASLDELPQLLNVIKGEMSLVGPRPVVRAELMQYGRTAAAYTTVRPGMTGLWQVSGRNDVSYAERVVLDNYYVRKLSPGLDTMILLKTVQVVVTRKGAC